jgi:hypothetical protein
VSHRIRALIGVALGFYMGAIWARGRAIGHPQEWQHFKRVHRGFIKKIPELDVIAKGLLTEQPTANTDARSLVFLLGCLCLQDYRELFLLCANGYGIAAAKVLRSLYEHAVTAQHIARHPENAPLFNEYTHVEHSKLLRHAEETLTPENYARLFTDDQKQRAEEEYERVRAHYKGQKSWSPLNLRDMAIRDGEGLEMFYSLCFAHPSSHVHATARGLYSRIAQQSGRIIFQAGPQRQEASDALHLGTIAFLFSLRTQARTFSPSVEQELLALAPKILSDWEPAKG